MFCNPVKVDFSLVAGEYVVKEGQLVNLDLPGHIRKHNQAAMRLLEG